MKIVSLTIVNNVSRLVEAFIRYNYTFFDEMIIVDIGSTDNTVEIINRMKYHEGYSLNIYNETLTRLKQDELIYKYLNIANSAIGADYVIYLDIVKCIFVDKSDFRGVFEQLECDKKYYINTRMCKEGNEEEQNADLCSVILDGRCNGDKWKYNCEQLLYGLIVPIKKLVKSSLFVYEKKVFLFETDSVEIVQGISVIRWLSYSDIQYVLNMMSARVRQIPVIENHDNICICSKSDNIDSDQLGKFETCELSLADKFCDCEIITKNRKYMNLSKETFVKRMADVSREMAIKAYCCELGYDEKSVLFWMDGIKGKEILFPYPSKIMNYKSQLYDTAGYVTNCDEISFLKCHHKLIVPIKFAKFIAHKYVVITDNDNYEAIKAECVMKGIEEDKIVTLSDYETQISYTRKIFCCLRYRYNTVRIFVSLVISRFKKYGLNGLRARRKR